MAGIAGIVSIDKKNRIEDDDFNRFFSCIMANKCQKKSIHRIHNGALVGVGELTGLQPKHYHSDDNDIQLFIWGHFFLSNGDAKGNQDKVEELLALREKKGNDFINHITGHFVIFLFDKLRDKYVLFNSSFGMMPIYYSIRGNKLYFSSRLQSFIDANSFEHELDKCSLLQYLIFNYSIDDSSFVKNIKIMPAASVVTNQAGIWNIEKYDNHEWLYSSPKYTFEQGRELVDHILQKTINNISGLIHPFGCSITGGWDGRLILSYLKKSGNTNYFLYTYGKKTHPDMGIAVKLSEVFNHKHLPVVLDEEFINSFQGLAEECLLLSDGLRPANRAHYILMARKLGRLTNLVISGNCGSNILKIIQAPSTVYNSYMLHLFKNKKPLEQSAVSIYTSFFGKNTWIKPFVSKEEFVTAILKSEIYQDTSIPLGKLFYHYMLTNIERKYFGTETASYSSYMYNHSPFIDSEFIKAVVQTPFYGGHYSFLEDSPLIRMQLLKLYAKIMLANDKALASFTSDRGFPITWFLTPQGRIAGFIKKKIILSLLRKKDPDPFNQKKGITVLSKKWNFNDQFFHIPDIQQISEEKIKALCWSFWFENVFLK